MYKTILTQFPENGLILTANRRLSRRLIAEHDQLQQSTGKPIWPTLNCQPLSSWLQSCWIDALTQGQAEPLILLNDEQEQLIWESIIKESEHPLLNIQATIQQIKQAWKLVNDYQLDLNDSLFHYAQAPKQFLLWSKDFVKHCHAHQYLDNARLTEKILDLTKKNNIQLPKKIILLGFLERTPLLEKIILTLEKKTNIEYIPLVKAKTQQKTELASLKNTQSEITGMANWAKNLLKEKSNLSIACIIPELTSLRPQVQRIFEKTLEPGQFNLSGGQALISEPIIHTALLTLKLFTRLSINDISYLLRSPFLASAEEELQKRALLDAKLRDKNYLTLNLKQLIKASKHCRILNQHLLSFEKKAHYQKQAPSKWAIKISEQLAAIAWPGDRPLNSREHQAIQQWNLVLEKFSNLDIIKPLLTFRQAIEKLNQLAQQQLFQIQTDDSAPIQVLGLLETVGLPFNYAWLMGLDDQHWPSPAKPHAFLPITLQKKHDLPHAGADRELSFAINMQKMLQTQTQQLILSHPQQEEDRSLTPSHLIIDFPLKKDFVIPEETNTRTEQLQNLKETAPATTAHEKIVGGSAIFKTQAACPFRAFSRFRLQADTIAQPEPGLTASDRGLLVHQVLEMFWQQVRSHQQLCTLSETLLEQTLNNLIQQAIEDQLSALSLSKRLLATEQKRLLQLLHQWILIEKSREPFVVIAEERWQSITVGGIPLRLQIDRIDQLEDGSFIIIDYKTGFVSLMNWFGDRPDDPQLPLYAVNNRDKLSGLYFAQIRADKMLFRGLSQTEKQLPGGKTLEKIAHDDAQETWEKQLDNWQAVLEQLAEDFHAGIASTDPKYEYSTCQYCEYHSLCRIHER